MLLEAVSVFKGTFESLHSDIHLNVAFISVLPGDILQHDRTPVQVDSRERYFQVLLIPYSLEKYPISRHQQSGK